MKNFTMIEVESEGVKSWRLLDQSGQPVMAFDMYAEALKKRHPHNTRRNYCLHLSRFLDYLCEAEKLSGAWDHKRLSAVVDAFPEWLMMGSDSGAVMARTIDEAYPSPRLAKTSSVVAIAAIKRFMELSELIRRELQELEEAGLAPAGSVDKATLVPDLGKKRQLTGPEIHQIKAKSMLAGVLSGGPKLIRYWELPVGASLVPEFDQDRAFPFDLTFTLINAFTTNRDKSLYAFCAASGCRIHEALQILWEDIDFEKRTVKLIDPKSRPNHPSYRALLPSQRSQMAWKGRSSATTLLLQPLADLFFHHLETYLKSEFIRHGLHQFVFQYSQDGQAGAPFFLAAESGRGQTFSLAASKVNAQGFGVHSLRHMYGTYMVNYFPNPNGGRGLPMEQVQKLMGHRSLSSTQKYAKYDELLIMSAMQSAPPLSQEIGAPNESVLHIKRAMLEKALRDLDAQIANAPLLGLGDAS